MSAERLREAGKVLRERAEATPGAPWFYSEGTDGLPSDGPTYVSVVSKDSGHPVCMGEYDSHDGHAAVYIAAMHPGVGLALADWLYDHASVGESWSRRGGVPYNYDPAALRVADLILGGGDQ